MTVHYASWGSQATNYNMATDDAIAGIDIYVSGQNGDDTNSGRVATAPLATLEEALRQVTAFGAIRQPVRIHVGANEGDAPYALPPMMLPLFTGPKASFLIIGDGAGQSGEDGFSLLLAAQASGGGSTTSAVEGTFGGTNNYKGKTLEVTSGAAEGARRTIFSNTTTVATVQAITGFAAGDSFRIVEPAVTLETANDEDGAHGILARGGMQIVNRGSGSEYDPAIPAVHFANFHVDDGGANFVRVEGATVAFFGVEFAGDQDTHVYGATIFSGCNVANTDCEAMEAITGDATVGANTWRGWCLSKDETPVSGLYMYFGSRLLGFLAVYRLILERSQASVTKGALWGGGSSALSLDWGSVAALSSCPIASDQSEPAVSVTRNSTLQQSGGITCSANSAAADCVLATGGSSVDIIGGVLTTANAGATKLNARTNAVIAFATGVTEGGSGTFCTIDSKATTDTLASFTSEGFAVQGAGSGTAAAGLSGGTVRRGAAGGAL